jgi:hypothetical protein
MLAKTPKKTRIKKSALLQKALGTFVFGFLRKLQRRTKKGWLKLSIANRYISIHPSILEDLATQDSDVITVHCSSESNKIGEYTQDFSPAAKRSEKVACLHAADAKTDTYILDIKSQEFSFRNNHLVDGELNIVDEFHESFERLHVYRNILEHPQKVKGTIAYLSNAVPSNYYHWMCRTLPLLRVYEKNSLLPEIDYFYVGNFKLTSWHKDSLMYAGIQPHRILQHGCSADRLLVAFNDRERIEDSAPMTYGNYRFVRNLFKEKVANDSEFEMFQYIYVARGPNVSYRYVLNESAVIEVLKRFGFKIISMDGKGLREEIQIFSHAKVIVSPTGAALTNLLFTNPGATVIELLPHGLRNNCFCALANYGQSNYFYSIGENTGQDHIPHGKKDVQVDIEDLKNILHKVFSKDH